MQRLLIGTQHPAYGGGVLTLVRAFLAWVRQRAAFTPALAYATLERGDAVNVTPGGLLHGRWRPRVREEHWEGVPAWCVGKVLPGIEALAGYGNQQLWRRVLAPGDVHQVICGYAVTGLPQALSGRRYVAWVASSMEGDKRARLDSSSLPRRCAYRLQTAALRRQERLVLERAAWVLALSPQTELGLLERGAARARLSCLPCPVDTTTFTLPATPPARPAVLWVARLNDPRKNTGLLIRAFARASSPDATLLLAGEGDPAPLRQLAEACGVAARVKFMGRLADRDLPALYRRATVFAIPSDQEGLCIAGLEAMACGVPVVSTRCGGPEAFVLPGKTGLLVDSGSETQLAEALRQLLSTPHLCQEMGRQARQLVEEQFSTERFGRHLDQVYAAVWPEHFAAPSS